METHHQLVIFSFLSGIIVCECSDLGFTSFYKVLSSLIATADNVSRSLSFITTGKFQSYLSQA